MHATHSNGHPASAQGDDRTRYIDDAKALARTHFDGDAITHQWTEDPESGERWIAVRADVRGSVESVLAAKKEYTSRWVESVPAPQRLRSDFHSISFDEWTRFSSFDQQNGY